MATPIQVPQHILDTWQSIADTMAEVVGVPAGLVMRLMDDEIEVLTASRSEGNPYDPGDRERVWGSGLYCERVMKTRLPLLVPDALEDVEWKSNPDIEREMISYLGLPLLLPDETPFGTICVLDRVKNEYSEVYVRLMHQFRALIESHLELLFMNQALGEDRARASEYVSEIQTLRNLLSICSFCKKIQDDAGEWQQIERYMADHSNLTFSHGLCPACFEENYPQQSK